MLGILGAVDPHRHRVAAAAALAVPAAAPAAAAAAAPLSSVVGDRAGPGAAAGAAGAAAASVTGAPAGAAGTAGNSRSLEEALLLGPSSEDYYPTVAISQLVLVSLHPSSSHPSVSFFGCRLPDATSLARSLHLTLAGFAFSRTGSRVFVRALRGALSPPGTLCVCVCVCGRSLDPLPRLASTWANPPRRSRSSPIPP